MHFCGPERLLKRKHAAMGKINDADAVKKIRKKEEDDYRGQCLCS